MMDHWELMWISVGNGVLDILNLMEMESEGTGKEYIGWVKFTSLRLWSYNFNGTLLSLHLKIAVSVFQYLVSIVPWSSSYI